MTPTLEALAPYTRLFKAGGVAALVVAAAAGGCTLRGVQADRDIAALKLEHSGVLLQAERDAAALASQSAAAGNRIVTTAQEIIDALQLTQAENARLRNALGNTQRGLRDAFTASNSARCPDPSDPAAVAASGAAGMVRAELFDRATSRAVELAAGIDEQHAYARAVAARYRSVAEELRALRSDVK